MAPAVARLTTAQRGGLYGRPGDTVRYATVLTPWGLKARCHKAVLGVFVDACNEASKTSRWVPRRIDSFAHRNVRGSSSVSLHSWALAWDFFATDPGVVPPGGVWKPDDTVAVDFARCFTDQGFTWGATFTRQDWPHIEWAGALPVVSAPTSQEEERMREPVDALPDPQGGIWVLSRDGAVRNYRGARHLGDYPGLPPAARQGSREFSTFEGNDRGGYTLIANDGNRYSWPL